MSTIRVFVVDDHGVMRAGLAALIQSQHDMEFVGEAGDAATTIARMRERSSAPPDVIIVDMELPDQRGVELAETLHRIVPSARQLALTMHDDAALAQSFFFAGGSGFVVKEALGEELVSAIRAVHQGRRYLNLRMAETAPTPDQRAADAKPRPALSKREREVLELLARGLTNQEIASELRVSDRTVGTYRQRIADKLGLRTRADIVRYALASGLLDARRS
jgi:DNA-binding NarL/FixJ family response regulator